MAVARSSQNHATPLDPRERLVLDLVRRQGPLSRQELHELTGWRPNTVGDVAETMIRRGLLREAAPRVVGRGRPRVPLEIDTERLRVLGLSLERGVARGCWLDLQGQPVGEERKRASAGRAGPVAAAAAIARTTAAETIAAAALSSPGFVDPQNHRLLLSASTGRAAASLKPLYAALPGVPIVVENDMHALAAEWLAAHPQRFEEDAILVSVDDAAIGAALLVGGRPNRGCVVGGNELGHTRLPIETDPCFCGHTGCLERIFSTGYLRRQQADSPDLAQRVGRMATAGRDPLLEELLTYVALAIANVVNFVRPRRLVLTTPLAERRFLLDQLQQAVRQRLLHDIASRIEIEGWERPSAGFAHAAACLALMELLQSGWHVPRATTGYAGNGGGTEAART